MSAEFDAFDSSRKRRKFWLFSNSMNFHINVPWSTKAFYVLKKKKKRKKGQRLNCFYEPEDDTFQNVCCFVFQKM